MEVLLCFLLDNVVAFDSLTTFFFLFLWWAIDDYPCIILSITWTWFVLDLSYDGMDNTFKLSNICELAAWAIDL